MTDFLKKKFLLFNLMKVSQKMWKRHVAWLQMVLLGYAWLPPCPLYLNLTNCLVSLNYHGGLQWEFIRTFLMNFHFHMTKGWEFQKKILSFATLFFTYPVPRFCWKSRTIKIRMGSQNVYSCFATIFHYIIALKIKYIYMNFQLSTNPFFMTDKRKIVLWEKCKKKEIVYFKKNVTSF